MDGNGDPMPFRTLALVLLLATAAPLPAQDRRTGENVTWAYAQVLRASPVYRLVQVPTTEQRCDSAPPPPSARPPAGNAGACRTVPVVYQERRLVGYDVEYTYKGETYMSRLAADPGARLRIRISVAPDDPAVDRH
jgi:uncharacterized protein YcfJ